MADNVLDTLSIQIEANASQSVEGIKRLSSALRSLATSTSKVNSAGINNVVTQIDRLSTVTGKFNTSANQGSTSAKRFSTSLSGIGKHSSNAGTGMKSLAYHFGKFYANCFLAIRGVKALGKAVSGTMDYLEGFNFFDVAINNTTKDDWKTAGYDSAQSYATGFKNALNNENAKLTGFNTDSDTGDLSLTKEKNLGLDISQIQTFQAEIVSLTHALGLSSSVSLNAADGLTKLAGDMSSLKNVDLSKVMNDFQSGLLGQSRALYKYGIDITNATLQTYAYENGISKAVSTMTQGEKAQLRLLAIIDTQSRVAWGDLANTINQPANQLRMFTTGIKNLALTIGKILMPMVTGVLPYLNAMVIALQRFFTWIANIAGIKLDSINTGQSSSDIFDGIEDSADDASSAVDNLNKKVKDLNKQLAPFDELNNMSTSSSGSGSSGSGSGAGDMIDLSDAINKAFDDYFKVWDKAYEQSVQKANDMADAIVNAFKSGDYKAIGTYISTAITDALNSIPWDSVYSVASGFGKGFAEFLNGLITPQEFYAVGKTIAGVLNTVLYSSLSFASTFDWSNFGNSIAMGINGVFENFDFKSAGQALSKWVNGLLTALITFLQNTNWQRVGQSIGEFFGNIDWKSVTWNLAQLIEAFAEALLNALEGWFTTDPLSATIVGGFAFMKLSGIGGIIGSAIADKLTVSETATIGEKISGKLKAVKVTVGISMIISGITMKAKSGSDETSLLEDAESTFLTAAGAKLVTGKWEVAIGVAIVLTAGDIGLRIGNALAGTDFTWEEIWDNLLDPSVWGDYFKYKFEAIGDALSEYWDNLKASIFGGGKNKKGKNDKKESDIEFWAADWWENMKKAFSDSIHEPDLIGFGGDILEGILDGFVAAFSLIAQPIAMFFEWVWNGICDIFGIHSPAKEMQPLGEYILQGIVEGFKGAWNSFTEAIKEFFDKHVAPIFSLDTWKKNIGSVKYALLDKWDSAKDWWDNNKPDLSEVKAKYESVKEKVSSKWGEAKSWWDNNKPDLKQVKTSYENFKEKVSSKWTEVKSYWGSKSALQQVKTSYENFKSKVSEKWTEVKSFWGSKSALSQVKTTYENFKSNVSAKWREVTSYWGSKSSLSKISATVENLKEKVGKQWNSLSDWWGKLSLPSLRLNIKLPHIKVDWKSYFNGKLSIPSFDVEWYAKGGFPTKGATFVAGEAGAEMVGNINGRTGVASNQEITGIREAVYDTGDAQLQLLAEQNSLLRQLLAKDMGISTRDVFNAVRQEDENFENMTGHSAFVR